MGRPPNVNQRVVVEDCEIIRTSDGLRCLKLWPSFQFGPNARTWPALVPALSNVWPQSIQTVCHNLSYTSVQKHAVCDSNHIDRESTWRMSFNVEPDRLRVHRF